MRHWAFALLSFLPAGAFAGEGINLDAIAGIYKTPRTIVTPDEKVHSEDILEIVKLSGGRVYFRTHLEAENGDICGLWGVASAEGGAFIYRQPRRGKEPCVLSITVDSKRIVLHDRGGFCKASWCGMRGAFDGTDFLISARRPIRHMTRLKSSRQYRDALEEAGRKP